jgi:hypothetical protein
MPPDPDEQLLAVDQVSTLFHSKIEMPSNMKVVSLEKLDNFCIGRFCSV